jgi:hypothetical protein
VFTVQILLLQEVLLVVVCVPCGVGPKCACMTQSSPWLAVTSQGDGRGGWADTLPAVAVIVSLVLRMGWMLAYLMAGQGCILHPVNWRQLRHGMAPGRGPGRGIVDSAAEVEGELERAALMNRSCVGWKIMVWPAMRASQ